MGFSLVCGVEEFVEVSWDELIELLVFELCCIVDCYGNEVIYGSFYGWVSVGWFYYV